jgi:hypothetical protein
MRFLADENFPGAAVRALRAAGHDVAWVHEVAAGSKDEAVLQRDHFAADRSALGGTRGAGGARGNRAARGLGGSFQRGRR